MAPLLQFYFQKQLHESFSNKANRTFLCITITIKIKSEY